MDIGLRTLAERIEEGKWPALSCPECAGSLIVEKVEDIESRNSKNARDEEGWEPEWIQGRFVATARCHLCGEPVVLTGPYEVDLALMPNGQWFGEYARFYRVAATSPGLRLATVPPSTPVQVEGSFKEAAGALWSSPASAANCLRRGVEALLDAKRVRKTQTTKGRRSRLTTHTRIEILKDSQSKVAEALMAVKWIGNEGSHAQTLTVQNVLDGAEILEWAVDLAFSSREVQLKRRITQVNRAKGARGLN